MSNTQSNHRQNGAATSDAKTPRNRAKTAKASADEIKVSPNGQTKGFANAKAEAHARKARSEDELWGNDRQFLVELNHESVANRLHGRVIKANKGFDISFPSPFAEQNEDDDDGDGDDGGDAYEPRARVCVLSYDPDKPYGFDLYVPAGANYKRIWQYVIDKLLLKETSRLRGKERKTLEEKTAKYISDRQREYRDYYDNTEQLYWEQAKAITPDDPAGKYLNKTRGVPLPEIDDALRYLPGRRFLDGKHKGEMSEPNFMIARALDQETDEGVFFHFTIIDPNGKNTDFKCSVSSRTIKKRHTKCGSIGYVPLRPGTYKMAAIGEGLETTLSAFKIPELDGMAVWAALSAKSLAHFPVRPDLDGVALLWDWEPPEPNSKQAFGPGQRAVEEVAQRYLKAGKEVFIVKPIKPNGKNKWDLNDVISAKDFAPGVGYTYEKFTGLPPDRQDYVVDGRGKFVLNATNISIFIARRNDIGPLLYFDEFVGCVMINGPLPDQEPCGPYPRRLEDGDCLALLPCIQWTPDFEKTTKELVRDGVYMFANNHRINPVTEYLDSLRWDGGMRVDTVFVDYLGAEATECNCEHSRVFMLSLAARAFAPGCQADQSAVLIGPQGYKKSTFLRKIAGEKYFSACLPELGGGNKMKEAQAHLKGRWLIEISEAAAILKTEVTKLKSFITTQVDIFRHPYGHLDGEHPRRCTFAITANDHSMFRDDTGARRFLPTDIGVTFRPTNEHMLMLEENRDQLFAEAVYRYKAGEHHYSDADAESRLLEPQQEAHRDIPMWEEEFISAIAEALASENVVVSAKSLRRYFMTMKSAFGKVVQPREYNRVLTNHGWARKSRRIKIKDEYGNTVSTKIAVNCWALKESDGVMCGVACGRMLVYRSENETEPGRWELEDAWKKFDDEFDAATCRRARAA